MKCKVTRKEIKENYKQILGVGYCSMQHLLEYIEPFAYSTRAEGWACDYYDVQGVCICTGYSPINGNVKENYKLIRRYEQKACKIVNNYNIKKTSTKQKKANALLTELLQKLNQEG